MIRIGIVGLGLIGGSLGLEFRAQGYPVVGVSRRQTTCDRACERGLVDRAEVNARILADVDVVFVCTPIGAIAPTLTHIIPHLQENTLVTDVGSVKRPIVEAVRPLWPHFIGGHPMAGTEQQGVEAGCLGLFQNAPYVLTPEPETPAAPLATLQTLVQGLGCRLYLCNPDEHDRAVARISHLPVMVSASLIATCSQGLSPEALKLAQELASSGFRDTSRVGGGNPELGMMMAQYNQTALLAALADYRDRLGRIETLIKQGDWPALAQVLQATQAARSGFL